MQTNAKSSKCRPASLVSRIAPHGAIPLGLATTVTLTLTACSAFRSHETTQDRRLKTQPSKARIVAESSTTKPLLLKKGPAPASRQDTLSAVYNGPLRREAARGIRIVRFPVPGPGDRPDEICVIPRHLPFGHYRGTNGAKDRADERDLASYDFYKVGTAESGAIGITPKRTSTSAAVRVYKLPPGMSRPQHLSPRFCRSIEKEGKQIAKFKQTDNRYTTTSTASILGYYHVSRALGDICEIKPAVLRTMDIPQHRKLVRLASEMGARGTVAKSWALFPRYYANPKNSPVARELFTSDFTQIYGALLENTRGEDDYTEWLQAETDLRTTRAFRYMADSRPARSILGSNSFTRHNVQSLVAMRDMSELILLDYLLAQSDRLSGGNISSYDFAYDLVDGEVRSAKASKAPEPESGASRVFVKKLTIKDTDGGLLNSNVFERKGYLNRIRHMHPHTYECLQRFAREWEKDPSVRAFFHQECTFSPSQLVRFEKNLRTAAATLRARKGNGTLRLDLDLDEFFKGVEPYAAEEALPVQPKVGLSESSIAAWQPLRSGTSSAGAGIRQGSPSASTPRFARLDPSDLPKGVQPYNPGKVRSSKPALGLREPKLAEWKPLRDGEVDIPPSIPPVQLPSPERALAQAETGETPEDIASSVAQ